MAALRRPPAPKQPQAQGSLRYGRASFPAFPGPCAGQCLPPAEGLASTGTQQVPNKCFLMAAVPFDLRVGPPATCAHSETHGHAARSGICSGVSHREASSPRSSLDAGGPEGTGGLALQPCGSLPRPAVGEAGAAGAGTSPGPRSRAGGGARKGARPRDPPRPAPTPTRASSRRGPQCPGSSTAASAGKEDQIASPRPLRSMMPTDVEPSVLAKTLHLIFLSTFWGMQIWVTFISGFVMGGNLTRHTLGFIQSRLFPYYFHIGSACAFFNLTIFAMCHPRELLNEEETTQLIVFFVCVIVSALNAQWFGQMTSDIMADMHLLEQSYGLGQDIGLFSRKSYTQLRESNPKYRQLSGQLNRYRLLSSLCNLGCLACNGFSLYYMATHLSTL
ncbi:uncharacterized protein LOC141540558 [Sminthopsis crassicaudata]|uniref:uncharacterized protein LOC141540558 n=1 Tax=Sminthopsis crassicaudata TaxID=9301 RepID=UPI003D686BDE